MKSHCLGPQLLSDYAFLHYNYKYDWLRPMERRIKRQDTRRASTVLFVSLNKKIHAVSTLELHSALSTEYSESGECTQHSVYNKS